jgi:gamma-glutamyl:cysteine ligase YbdK (ATP-grasp superfamily)
MVGYTQVHDEEYDPNEDQDHPDGRGYRHHRNSAVWSAARYTNDGSIVAQE